MASASEQRRAAEYQQAQTRLQTILGEQQADRNSARERQLLGLIGTEAGSQFDRGISDFQRASTTPFNLQRSSEFDAETTGTPEAVTRLQQLIREQALPEQQRALAQGKIALQQAGVRGPEAALMQQRQQNRMQTDLANRAEQIALQQALSDRGIRQQFASQRGLQQVAQARADRAAQQQFARDRAIGSQEKSFGRNVTAQGRQRFSNESVTEAALRPRTWASLQDQSKRGEMFGGQVDLGKNQKSVNVNKIKPPVSQPVSKPVSKPVSQPVSKNINLRRRPRAGLSAPGPWNLR